MTGTEVVTWRISLPNVQGEGWAIIFLDETGCFTALSDYGDVAYRWSDHGWGKGDFRAFLIRCDDYYLTTKFGRGRKEYDRQGTLEAVKERIEELRADGSLSEEKAAEEVALLDRYDDLHNEFDFGQWYLATSLEEAGELHQMRTESDVTNFVREVMPRLRERLRADLSLTIPIPAGSTQPEPGSP